jgi:hypothetical protein
MLSTGFEHAILAIKQPQNHALNRTTIGIAILWSQLIWIMYTAGHEACVILNIAWGQKTENYLTRICQYDWGNLRGEY